MSLSTASSPALNQVVAAVTSLGVTVVVAAGNQAADAAKVSPASAPSAITVAASDIDDKFATFSNFGASVDLIAPGVGILSSYHLAENSYAIASGTSMGKTPSSGWLEAARRLSVHRRGEADFS